MNLLPSLHEENCQKCSLHKLRTHIVPSYLPNTTEVLFLGEGPGYEEDIEGTRPLIGPAGKNLSQLLKASGFKVADERIGYSNCVRCRAKETNEKNIKAGKSNRQPSDKEIRACASYLDAEIKSLPNLKVIVCLGATAVKRIFGKTGMKIQELRGKVLEHDVYGKVIVTHHPARPLHSQDSREKALLNSDIQSDLRKVLKLIEGTEERKEERKVIHKVIRNITQARWLIDQLLKAKLFAFDTETSNFDPFNSTLLCFSFSWKLYTGFCLPIVGYACKEIWSKEEKQEILEGLKKVFINPNSKKVAQNGKFDLQHLRVNGIEVNNFYSDTMLMSYLLDENGSHGLKELAWMYTDAGGYEERLEKEKERVSKERKCKKEEVSFQYLNTDLLWAYACYDADITLRLMYILWPKLEKENLIFTLREVFIPICLMLTNVEYGGVSVDRTYLDSMILEYNKRIKEMNKDILNDRDVKRYVKLLKDTYKEKRLEKYRNSKYIQKRYDEKEYCEKGIEKMEFNAKSPKQLRELFINMLKMPILQRTDKGNAQLNATVLEIYAERISIAKTLSYQNKLKQLQSTFLVGIREELRADNKLHSNFSQTNTVTGRLASFRPNLQNIPNKDKNPKESKEIRDLFVGDREEDVIIEGDLGQAEFRIWGQLAHDEVMYKDLEQGVDIHRKFASIGYEILEEKVTDKERTPTKGIVFGTIYGRSPKSVAIQLNMPEDKAKKVQQALFHRYQKSATWIEEIKVFARKHGYVRGLFGNIRHLQDSINHPDAGIRAHAERQAVNSPVQGSSSIMNCLAGVKIEKEFREKGIDGRILMFIHDAIVINVKRSQAYEAYKIMHDCMIHPHPKIDVPLTADFKVGKRWGSAIKVKDDEEFKKALEKIESEELYSIFVSENIAWIEKEPVELTFIENKTFYKKYEKLQKWQAYRELKFLEEKDFNIDVLDFKSTKFYSVLTHPESQSVWTEEEPFDFLQITNKEGTVEFVEQHLIESKAIEKMKKVAKEYQFTYLEK